MKHQVTYNQHVEKFSYLHCRFQPCHNYCLTLITNDLNPYIEALGRLSNTVFRKLQHNKIRIIFENFAKTATKYDL